MSPDIAPIVALCCLLCLIVLDSAAMHFWPSRFAAIGIPIAREKHRLASVAIARSTLREYARTSGAGKFVIGGTTPSLWFYEILWNRSPFFRKGTVAIDGTMLRAVLRFRTPCIPTCLCLVVGLPVMLAASGKRLDLLQMIANSSS